MTKLVQKFESALKARSTKLNSADVGAGDVEQLDPLKRTHDITDRERGRRSIDEVPERLKDKDVAKAHFDLVKQQPTEATPPSCQQPRWTLRWPSTTSFESSAKVDWTQDVDVQNRMKIHHRRGRRQRATKGQRSLLHGRAWSGHGRR